MEWLFPLVVLVILGGALWLMSGDRRAADGLSPELERIRWEAGITSGVVANSAFLAGSMDAGNHGTGGDMGGGLG